MKNTEPTIIAVNHVFLLTTAGVVVSYFMGKRMCIHTRLYPECEEANGAVLHIHCVFVMHYTSAYICTIVEIDSFTEWC